MLSKTENEKLTQTDPGTPMGDYIRRFWIPFRLSSDVPEADGEPVRIRLMGEELLAFRSTSGKVGLIQRNCPHRWADLFYGRNEKDGIRCVYHGWKFNTQGQCVDMPTETDESTYKDKVKIASYPVEEVAGILWTYMGPKNLTPELPDLEYLRMPESHRFVSWNWQQTNYAQAIEGGIDSAHSNYLHATLDAYHMTDAWRSQWERSQNLRDKFHARDPHPKFFADDTEYGVITGARRDTGEGEFYWRYNLFLLPFYTMAPSGPLPEVLPCVRAHRRLPQHALGRSYGTSGTPFRHPLSRSGATAPVFTRPRSPASSASALPQTPFLSSLSTSRSATRRTTTSSAATTRSDSPLPASPAPVSRTSPCKRAWVTSPLATRSTSAPRTSASSSPAAA